MKSKIVKPVPTMTRIETINLVVVVLVWRIGRNMMRNPDRIKPFCDELAELWVKYPDLRFGQLMSNIARNVQIEHRKDMFFMEEEELMDAIKEYLK